MTFGFNQTPVSLRDPKRQFRVTTKIPEHIDATIAMVTAEHVGFQGAQVWFYNGPDIQTGLVRWFNHVVEVLPIEIEPQDQEETA